MTDNKTGAEEETVTYTYDVAGNRLTEMKGGNTTSYSYNNLKQLTEVTETGTGSSVIRTFSYDRNGNQTAEVTKEGTVETERRTFTYDEANRLTGLSVKEGETVTLTQSNRYSGEGQRIEKVETKLASGLEGTTEETEKTEYYYQNGAVLYTEDANGNRSSMNLMGASGNIIATSRGTGDSESWYLYNKDIRESTSSIIGADGNAAATYEYDDFGNTTITSGEDFNNEICYTGQVYDRSSGLYYYNARFYDPENGRFMTQDTYRGESNRPDTLHLYAYCANNPINYVDPSGHVPIPIALYKIWRSFGFVWDFKQGIFYTKKDCAQYYMGYCDTYDRIGNMVVDIKSIRSVFKYKNKWWRIQLWKGRYGLTNGGEIGVYTSGKKNGWYRCAKKSDMLKMNISLKNTKTGKNLFSRSSGKGVHWWLNGFKPGKKVSNVNLKLSGSITLKSVAMAKKFEIGLNKNSLKTRQRVGKMVSFTWTD